MDVLTGVYLLQSLLTNGEIKAKQKEILGYCLKKVTLISSCEYSAMHYSHIIVSLKTVYLGNWENILQ
jgi:hypothetical protein